MRWLQTIKASTGAGKAAFTQALALDLVKEGRRLGWLGLEEPTATVKARHEKTHDTIGADESI